jgi:hypothetical protein
VESLIEHLVSVAGADVRFPDEVDQPVADESVLLVDVAHGPRWDQDQDFVDIHWDDREHTIHVVHPGLDDLVGDVPVGWEATQERLWSLVNPVDE